MITSCMIEKRFPGMLPAGLSPINPEGWLPAGLKYLREIIFHFGCALAIDFNSIYPQNLDYP